MFSETSDNADENEQDLKLAEQEQELPANVEKRKEEVH